ncbi:cupin domain-containing protein [Actibacterium sp. 188UL27-1]|uniref:cupin domain-containing protein n=1 Tax=Actibacterium sp. 188UL27-1 TaxID=2786961 RepID=UPI0019563E06|nr:cupin domain-containing protein [Actibacterium sp. 188UL27-1]MBM7067129.1 cupin domain-containing protein [Actibacterium sp. 188UL27-1]
MKAMKLTGLAVVMAVGAWAAVAQEAVRTELSRADVPGVDTLEVIVTRLEVPPGATVPRHSHPGDEHLVVIVGGQMQAGNGKVIPFPDGMSTRFPDGEPHGGLTNVGDAPLVAITTHIVRKGEPLMSLLD